MSDTDALLPVALRALGYAPGARPLLADIDLELRAGGITVLLGPNGAGKSLLLQTIGGLIAPSTGTIRWNGAAAPAQRIAMVMQQPMLLRDSVAANVAIALKPLRLSRDQARARVLPALERFGLAGRSGEYARLLSGGERQRLALARAWTIGSPLMLLDEPTAALDPSGVDAIERIIRQIAAEGTTIVMSTQSLAQASRLADDVVFIDGGRVREHAGAVAFFEQPRSEQARLFMKAELPWQNTRRD